MSTTLGGTEVWGLNANKLAVEPEDDQEFVRFTIKGRQGGNRGSITVRRDDLPAFAAALNGLATPDRGPVRRARVAIKTTREVQIVQSYLPTNYRVTGDVTYDGLGTAYVTIEGTDDHGWSLDGYVIPRLASGLYRAEEV